MTDQTPVTDAAPAAPVTAPAPAPAVDPRDALIAELQRQHTEMLTALAAAQAAAALPPMPVNRQAEPTHIQQLACGCTMPVVCPGITGHYCDTEGHGLQPVVAYHEITKEVE
jgi:hypothetical protein